MTHPVLSPKVCIIPEFSDPECLDAQIHRVWEDYRKSRSKKQRRELKAEYERLTSLDTQKVGWKRYSKI